MSKSGKRKTAILISGRGSNMSALLRAAQDPDFTADISLVISNRPAARGLKVAADAGVATLIIDHKQFERREDFEAALNEALGAANIDIICLAGFMRLLTADFVAGWRDRMINIHPSLLPAFKGLDTHARVLDAGARISGCTVHFVRAEMDEGPIIAQAAVPVLPGDSEDELSARVLKAEHELYPLALSLLASGKIRVVNDKVIYEDAKAGDGLLLSPAG